MKTILLHIDDGAGGEARLQAAFDLARAFGGHIICLQVTAYAAYAMGEPGFGAFPVTELIAAIEAERDAVRARVEARLASEGVSWEWQARDGDAAERLIEAARLADVVVLGAGPFKGAGATSLSLTGAVAIGAPAPVVAVPPGSHGLAVTGAAVIAWDGSQEAAVAMRLALPMLKLAESVELLTIAEKSTEFPPMAAAAWLSRHGVVAEIVERAADGSIAATIRAELTARRAAWLVQGAYGHSRLRQTLFGGVTRGLLEDAPVPVLLGH